MRHSIWIAATIVGAGKRNWLLARMVVVFNLNVARQAGHATALRWRISDGRLICEGDMKMRRFCLLALVISVILSATAFRSEAESASVRGDYVEVRTASVFAGACHYNGELTTSGRDALIVWNVTSGEWRGIDLTGVRVVAIISADANLAEENAPRRAEIIVDQNASHQQAVAMLEILKSRSAASLGEIISVRSAPINFQREGKAYSVSANGLVSINVEAMPNDLCCKMPSMVWYSPLMPLENRKVGYTRKAAYAGSDVGAAWQRSGENSAFYGSFAF
jgi:hypothetical protein